MKVSKEIGATVVVMLRSPQGTPWGKKSFKDKSTSEGYCCYSVCLFFEVALFIFFVLVYRGFNI